MDHCSLSTCPHVSVHAVVTCGLGQMSDPGYPQKFCMCVHLGVCVQHVCTGGMQMTPSEMKLRIVCNKEHVGTWDGNTSTQRARKVSE